MPMKLVVLAAISGMATLVAGTAANALTFTYSGHIDSYAVPTSGYYQVDAWGAQGGSYIFTDAGGLGAMVGGRIYLDAGQTLSIVVGGAGRDINSNTGGGGGGASWVYVSSDLELLLAAGGGGGAAYATLVPGGPGLTGRNGGGSGGGVDGLGGGTGGNRYLSGGGAGWLGPGASGTVGIYGTGGSSAPSFQGGWTHGCISLGDDSYECENGQSGGFGGGGGASYGNGGGGGGYSGGGGTYGSGFGSGGGGSYIAPEFSSVVAESGVRAVPVIPGLEVPSPGLVTIDPVPEPATWTMMLVGVFGLGAALRSRSPRRVSSVC
jgi:hypothetical protein